MRVSRYGRRFHDPHGNKFGNRFGSVMRHVYMVGIADLNKGVGPNREQYYLDNVKRMEANRDRFVMGKRSLESLRR